MGQVGCFSEKDARVWVWETSGWGEGVWALTPPGSQRSADRVSGLWEGRAPRLLVALCVRTPARRQSRRMSPRSPLDAGLAQVTAGVALGAGMSGAVPGATRARARCAEHEAPSAVHLVAGSTTSPVQAQIAGSELARPLVNASVEHFSRANHVFTRILLQSSISHRLFGCIRSVSGSASYGVQGHSGNAHMQTYADAQQARASSPVLSTRCVCDFCTLALGHPCRGACIKSSTGVDVLHEYRVFTLSSPFSAT